MLTRLLTCTRDSRDARLPCNPIRDAAHGLAIGVFGGKHQSSIQPFSQSVSQLVSQSLSQSASQPVSQSVSYSSRQRTAFEHHAILAPAAVFVCDCGANFL